MTASLITITAQFGRQIGIQVVPTHERTVGGGMTFLTGQFAENCLPQTIVISCNMAHMTLPTELIARLNEQVIVLTAMRLMACNAPAPFYSISVSGFMLKKKGSTLHRMAVVADPVKII